MAVLSTSLITVAEYLRFLGEPSDITSERRGQLEQAIDWASDQVEDYVGRTLISGSSATEIFDGLGEPHPELLHDRYTTTNAPLITSPSPKLYVRSSSQTWSAIAQTKYTYDATDGEIWFTDAGYFISGRKNYRVVYDYGYASTSTIPKALKRATALLVKLGETQSSSIGVVSTASADGKNKTYSSTMPPSITDILDVYVR